jgi:hypothetical protein
LTDPLTGKELVEKSYEYIDKLTRECAKSLVDEFNKTHRKFDPKSFPIEVGNSIILWFNKRDKNVKLNLDLSNVQQQQQQPNMARIRFKGSTKDADFEISATVGSFSVPTEDGKLASFVKTLVFSVEKNSFQRRKI